MPWPLELALMAWTSVAAGWLAYAFWLAASNRPPLPPAGAATQPPSLTVFKPLPPLAESEQPRLERAVESFLRQAGPDVEILIGVPEPDHARWSPTLGGWRTSHGCRVKIVLDHPHPGVPNPKISWQRRLAQHATGELWLWSDADIVAPPGFLDGIRAELAVSKARALTCPYSVRHPASPDSLLDAIFVNVEFLPGVLMLARRGAVSFALGAGVLFRADDFRRLADWERLGATLADDNELGRQLAPVAISTWMVETLPMARGLTGALSHYLRWHKTVRWCEPLGYAGQALVMPMLGWLGAILLFGAAALPGAAVTLLLESTMAWALCRRAGCRIPSSWAPLFVLWPIIRILTWFSSWLPTPVTWAGRKNRWWGLRRLELFERAKSP